MLVAVKEVVQCERFFLKRNLHKNYKGLVGRRIYAHNIINQTNLSISFEADLHYII
jgi:hypothetical protein